MKNIIVIIALAAVALCSYIVGGLHGDIQSLEQKEKAEKQATEKGFDSGWQARELRYKTDSMYKEIGKDSTAAKSKPEKE
jgi:hypothetical protein